MLANGNPLWKSSSDVSNSILGKWKSFLCGNPFSDVTNSVLAKWKSIVGNPLLETHFSELLPILYL